MSNKPWFQANIHAPGTGIALVVIALTLLPVGIDAAMRAWCVAAPYKGTTLTLLGTALNVRITAIPGRFEVGIEIDQGIKPNILISAYQ